MYPYTVCHNIKNKKKNNKYEMYEVLLIFKLN